MPRTGPVLILANHESFLDPLAVGLAVRRHIRYLAKKPLFSNPRPGPLPAQRRLRAGRSGRAWPRRGCGPASSCCKRARRCSSSPRASAASHGQMQPFKAGISLILKRAPVPVVPVGVAGRLRGLPRGAAAAPALPDVLAGQRGGRRRLGRQADPAGSATRAWAARSSAVPLRRRRRAGGAGRAARKRQGL